MSVFIDDNKFGALFFVYYNAMNTSKHHNKDNNALMKILLLQTFR